jgi:membrane protease subunit HflK
MPWPNEEGLPTDEFVNRIKTFFKGKRYGGQIIFIGIVLLWLVSGIYIVSPAEQGVVRRFGKMVRITSSGLRYRIPWPVEKVDTPRVTEVKRIEVGFRTIDPGPPARYQFIPAESLMLTGDENIVDCQIIVQYKIKDPADYLFNVKDIKGTLHDASEVALRQVIGNSDIDDALTIGKLRIQQEIRELLQRIMDGYESGILITEVKLQTVRPPREVEAAFKDVVSAKEDRERLIYEAKGYQEDIIPKTKGQAAKILREAEAYREERIKRAQGDAGKFLAILKEYEKAKDVTRERLYLETMEEILPNVKKVIIDSKVGGGLLQLLPLEEMVKPILSTEEKEKGR